MPRDKLTDRKIKTADTQTLSDGAGLYLRKEGRAQGRWYYRFTLAGRREVMGLGGWPTVSLKEARESRDHWQKVLRAGVNPKTERDSARAQLKHANENTLEEWFERKFEALKPQLRNNGKSARWDGPLRNHIMPKIGARPIEQIDQFEIERAFKPIWNAKAETAEKAIQRLAMVFDHAAAGGLNVSRETVRKARLLLGKQERVKRPIPAMAWSDVPAFYASLGEGTTELALRLLILTGTRSGSLRNCRIDQIQGHVWTIPPEFMKAQKHKAEEFEVPLSEEALAVIDQAAKLSRDGFLFPGRSSGPISDMTLTAVMRRRGLEARPHGFRSSLRSWIADATETPFEVAEAVLAHKVGNSVSQAYQRSNLLEKRRALMKRWAGFVTEN